MVFPSPFFLTCLVSCSRMRSGFGFGSKSKVARSLPAFSVPGSTESAFQDIKVTMSSASSEEEEKAAAPATVGEVAAGTSSSSVSELEANASSSRVRLPLLMSIAAAGAAAAKGAAASGGSSAAAPEARDGCVSGWSNLSQWCWFFR